MMTLTDLRAELEQFAANGCTAADIDRLNQAWKAVREKTPQSYHAVINDRLKALSVDVVRLPKASVATEASDFTLHQQNGSWHWYSCGPIFSDNYRSEDGFDTQAEAITDAVDFLTSVYNSDAEDNDFSELESATSIDIELGDTSPYQSGVHFALYEYEDNPGVHWQGLCQEPGESSQWWNTDADFAHLVSGEAAITPATLPLAVSFPCILNAATAQKRRSSWCTN